MSNIKIIPLTKIYFKKYPIRVSLNIPLNYYNNLFVRGKKHSKYKNIALPTITKKQIINFEKRFNDCATEFKLPSKIKSNLFEHYPRSYSSLVYGHHIVFLNSLDELAIFEKYMGEYITQIERPITENHTNFLLNKSFVKREIRKNLYYSNFKYKVSIKVPYSINGNTERIDQKALQITELLSCLKPEEYVIKKNFYSVNVGLTNTDTFMIFKLMNATDTTLYEAILPNEIEEAYFEYSSN